MKGGIHAKKVITATVNDKGVVVWDTTVTEFCKKLRAYDNEVKGYRNISDNLQKANKYSFTTKSGVHYVIDRLEKD